MTILTESASPSLPATGGRSKHTVGESEAPETSDAAESPETPEAAERVRVRAANAIAANAAALSVALARVGREQQKG